MVTRLVDDLFSGHYDQTHRHEESEGRVRSCEKVENFVKIDGLSLLISNIAATPPTALILSSFSVRDGPTRILFKEKSNPRIRNRERCPIPFHLVVQRSLKEPGVHGVPTGRRCPSEDAYPIISRYNI